MTYMKNINQSIFIVLSLIYSSTTFPNTVKEKEKNAPEVIKEIPLEVIFQENVSEPGGIVTFTLTKPTIKNFSLYLGQTKAVCIERQNSLKVITGVDINTLFGKYLLSAKTKKEQLLQIPFQVKPFAPQYLDKAPDMNGVKLISAEEVSKSLLWSNREPKLPLIAPVIGNWSKDFGAYYNQTLNESENQKKNLQKIDSLRLDINTPTIIGSPSNAVVFTIYFDEKAGYRILLDHGMGLFSEISGLPSISVEEQDVVTQGALIANFTTSDFVKNRSPQKHTIFWRVFLTKALINPKSLMRSNNEYSEE